MPTVKELRKLCVEEGLDPGKLKKKELIALLDAKRRVKTGLVKFLSM